MPDIVLDDLRDKRIVLDICATGGLPKPVPIDPSERNQDVKENLYERNQDASKESFYSSNRLFNPEAQASMDYGNVQFLKRPQIKDVLS